MFAYGGNGMQVAGAMAERATGKDWDALFQREPSEGENQTDIIMLTHDAVERDVNAAIRRIEALPTVLAPIVNIRKEELS